MPIIYPQNSRQPNPCRVRENQQSVLEGLEYRVKSPKSLYNKLYQRVEKSFFDSLADVVRYTIILDPEDYVEQTVLL